MIHDLDLLLTSVELGGRVDRGRRRERVDPEDRHRQRAPAVRVRLHRQRDGQPDQPRPRRKARFFQHDSYVSIDYAAQEVEVYRLVAQNGGRPQIQGGKLDVEQRRAAAARAGRFRRRGPRSARAWRDADAPGATRWRWRRRSPKRWKHRQCES